MKKYDFVRIEIKKAKEELKSRKHWKKALEHELGLQRTWANCYQGKVMNSIKIAKVMIKHYEVIVEELETMLKEMKKIEGE